MRPLKFFSICTAAALLSGCAGYSLGPVNGETAGDKSVEVLPFNNQTFQPRIGDEVTQALRERIQTDGTYHLDNSGTGDIVITGLILRYNRQPMSFLNTDIATVSNYRVAITARITACERESGKVLFTKELSGSTFVHVGTDLADAERQAAPLLAEDLARAVVEQLAEGAW